MATESHFLDCAARRTRPVATCLALLCGDGTWQEQVSELLQSEEATMWDRLAWPGGPIVLCAEAARFREHHVARTSLAFLVARHETRRIALIAHDFCGHYARLHPKLYAEQIRALQRKHLSKALRNVVRWHPQINVGAFLMRGEVDGSCWVEKVPLMSSSS